MLFGRALEGLGKEEARSGSGCDGGTRRDRSIRPSGPSSSKRVRRCCRCRCPLGIRFSFFLALGFTSDRFRLVTQNEVEQVGISRAHTTGICALRACWFLLVALYNMQTSGCQNQSLLYHHSNCSSRSSQRSWLITLIFLWRQFLQPVLGFPP